MCSIPYVSAEMRTFPSGFMNSVIEFQSLMPVGGARGELKSLPLTDALFPRGKFPR